MPDLDFTDGLVMEAVFPGRCVCGQEYPSGAKLTHLPEGWFGPCCTDKGASE